MVDNAFAINEQPIAIPAGAQDVDLGADIEQLHVRVAALQEQNERERVEHTNSVRKLLLGILDVADALDRVIASADASPENERQRRNVVACRRLLARRLEDASVKPMVLVGDVVDPALADVEDSVTRPDLPEETVVQEILSGYRLDDYVLRRARVIVSTQD